MESDIHSDHDLMMALEYIWWQALKSQGVAYCETPFCQCEGFEPDFLIFFKSTKEFHKQNFHTFFEKWCLD
jgi:hypothetical protein